MSGSSIMDPTQASPVGILDCFPNEVIEQILVNLPNSDKKSIRLTSTYYGEMTSLQLDRVFLSSHRRDLQVLREVAEHEKYRHNVFEIVYDVANLNGTRSLSFGPEWYGLAQQEAVEEIRGIRHHFAQRPIDAEIEERLQTYFKTKESTNDDSWKLFKKLVRQQRKAKRKGEEARALRYALTQFPNLRRITFTASAHGMCFLPKYKTPFIRSLPRSFVYPAPPREIDSDDPIMWLIPAENRDHRRELSLVVETLASHPEHGITEFAMDYCPRWEGLDCLLLDGRFNNGVHVAHFVTMLSEPLFRRLDLALNVTGQEADNWPSFRQNRLKGSLECAPGLEHFSLTTNFSGGRWAADLEHGGYDGNNENEQHVPLKTVFPVELWTQLRHFGLSGFPVKQDDLIDFLAAMPPSLRSVDLSFLFFSHGSGETYWSLLNAMKSVLDWNNRPVVERPKIIIHTVVNELTIAGHTARIARPELSIDISNEATKFMYEDAENPFKGEEEQDKNGIRMGSGSGILRNAFIPVNDVPNLTDEELIEMGIYEEELQGLGNLGL